MMFVETAGVSAGHQLWCTGHSEGDGSPSGCRRTVEIAGVQIELSETRGLVQLTVLAQGQAPLTAAQVRQLAAELVDASRLLQRAEQP